MYKAEYYKDFYGDRETYARRQAGFHTFAVVTSDGIWLEEANMGWFAWTDATPKSAADWENNFIKNFIDGEDPEKRITVVDCHVQSTRETAGFFRSEFFLLLDFSAILRALIFSASRVIIGNDKKKGRSKKL